MKKLKLLLFILLTTPIYSQWVQQNSGVGVTLNDVYCITEDIVVVVGNNGTILKTTNGGINWVQKNSNTTSDLTKVQFINQTIGYCVGGNGALLKTIDGGENWSLVITGETSYIVSLSCVNENIFYISCNDWLKRTTNGGLTFEGVNTFQTHGAESVQFINELTGYALSSNNLNKTIDGGNTWTIVENDTNSFCFLNENIGFVNTSIGISKTSDGCISFTNLCSINHTMLKLFAASENIIWGVTGEMLLNGQPNYTTRGEITGTGLFQKIDSVTPILKSIYFINPTKGYGVGWGGGIYKNTSGTMLALNKVNNENEIKIYPNPVTEEINIAFSKNSSLPFSVEISDTLGKVIFSKLYNDEYNITINTKYFSKGIYFLCVVNYEKQQTQKLIIN